MNTFDSGFIRGCVFAASMVVAIGLYHDAIACLVLAWVAFAGVSFSIPQVRAPDVARGRGFVHGCFVGSAAAVAACGIPVWNNGALAGWATAFAVGDVGAAIMQRREYV